MNVSRSSKEDLKQFPAIKRQMGREEFKAIRKSYFEHGREEVHKVVLEVRNMGFDELGSSELVGNGLRKVRGLVNKYNWDKKRGEIERKRREEETIASVSLNFPKWLEKQEPKWFWRWRFQRLIYTELEKIDGKKPRRLMVFLPPRHGKSELVTVRFAAWMLGHRPKTKIIIGSYNQKLANRFSRKVRRIYLNNRPEGALTETRPPGGILNTADDWETPEGGGVKAVGAGAGVTGFGADLIIIDDPIKSRADANSENNRERIWDWFNDDLNTRLEPNGSIILIQTRWHEDDLAGRLLREAAEGGGQWDVIRLPALAEKMSEPPATAGGSDPIGRKPGEALCPERFSREALLEKKRKLGSESFEALYQQNPVPAGGGLFKRVWFKKIVSQPPPGLKWVRGYDTAVSIKTTADYTASFRCALDTQGNLYIADGSRMRIEYPDQRRFIIERIQAEPDTEHGIEETLHGKAIIQDLRRERHLTRSVFCGVRVTVDKVTRASSWAARAEEGKVILVQGAWIREFLDEVCSFPNGRHDDQVDAVSVAVQMIEKPKFKHAGF